MTDGVDAAPGDPAARAVERFRSLVGREVGVSGWRTISQGEIDAFADVTDDHQYIHIDPDRAAAEPRFGGTVAHGFLTLSLLSAFGREALPPVPDRRTGVNYGFDRVRFVSPVRSGAKVRGRFVLAGVERRSPSEIALRYHVTVEIEGEAKPALVAEWLTLAVLE